MKNKVRITLFHQGETENFTQHFEGFFYDVEPLGYLRYAEQDPQMGQSHTTIRLLPDELRITRKGDVGSQLNLKPMERTSVTYRLGNSQLQMTAYTTRLDYHWLGGEGKIECHYELWLDDQRLEQIRLHLHFVII
jgi:uncharacterized beta-barrel protein YwiB (DUF1934 family)